jgi:potassium efflux system protein
VASWLGRLAQARFAARVALVAACLACGALASATGAAAQDEAPSQAMPPGQAVQAPPLDPAGTNIAAPIARWNEALARIDAALAVPVIAEDSLDRIREEIKRVQAQVSAYLSEQRPRLPEIEARYKKLGEAPKSGEPAEPAPVAQQRVQLRTALGELAGALRAAEEAELRADLLSARASDMRRGLFEKRILERVRSPLSPSLWTDIAKDTPLGLSLVRGMIDRWWRGVSDKPLFIIIVAASILLWCLLSIAGYRGIVRYRNWTAPQPPTQWRRTASAGRVILLRTLPTIIAGAALYFGLEETGLLSDVSERLVIAAVVSLVIVSTVQAVTKTALAIHRPTWRLLALTDEAAGKLYVRLMALAALYGLDFFINSLNQTVSMPFALSTGQAFVSSVLFAVLIISILRVRETNARGIEDHVGPGYLRLPLWLVALTILGAAVTGYVTLARFIAGQLIVTSTIFIVAYLMMISVSAFGEGVSDDDTPGGRWLREHSDLDERRREQIALPVTLLMKAGIVLAAVPIALLLWGFDWHDISSWFRQLLFGFEVGGVKISVTSVVAALVIFFFAYLAAKFFQAWLDRDVLERAGVEPGVRDSVRTGVGYIGIAMAALLAISYAGLDFSSLAIVAGALSVGVGFGLQSVVNNFVSGLILLAERPIKLGDWIIVGGHEGIVRRISVRSTEIETFDRANVIVPNSMLISDMVKNWTLHNSTGRVPVPVSVHLRSDPEQVRDILLEVARQHPQVLANPESVVLFEAFGASSLDFILFVYLINVNRSFAVRTDLRIAILKAFRKHGVEIPYPQSDVHLRDLDWVKAALAEHIAKTADGGPMSVRDYKSESQTPGEADNGT